MLLLPINVIALRLALSAASSPKNRYGEHGIVHRIRFHAIATLYQNFLPHILTFVAPRLTVARQSDAVSDFQIPKADSWADSLSY